MTDQTRPDEFKTNPTPKRRRSSTEEESPYQSTRSFVNSSKLDNDENEEIKQEVGLHVGVPNFLDTIFKDVPGLLTASKTAFKNCTKGDHPLFNGGWTGWQEGAEDSDLATWLIDIVPILEGLVADGHSIPPRQRKLMAQPRTPLLGATGKRTIDIGFVDSGFTYKFDPRDLGRRWSNMLVAGEVKGNPRADRASIAWVDLAKVVKEVFSSDDTRRFVFGFTLCGSLMRIWLFDRVGGMASELFDINKNGQMFVTAVLGFLWMDEKQLGFDPTIISSASGERYIEIERNGETERLIIEEVIMRAYCITGRATTCWKAFRPDDPFLPLVVKDSWQYTNRDVEGEMLSEATAKGVINVSRYYHHETVSVDHADDDVFNNIRKGLDVTAATNYGPPYRGFPKGLANRVHRRTIVHDYGKPIFKASSRAALLGGLVGCIEGHKSLHRAGLLHRDISLHNLMINEDEDNPSFSAFIIDLDLAIREQSATVSRQRNIGTRPFMAIGALLGETHTFMHDLESFFWVLFWICIHFDGPEARDVEQFDKWNYVDPAELVDYKQLLIRSDTLFVQTMEENFTPFYRPLINTVRLLKRTVFPGRRRRCCPQPELYFWMTKVLVDAQRDPFVIRSNM